MSAARLRELAQRLRSFDTTNAEAMLLLDDYADELEGIACDLEG